MALLEIRDLVCEFPTEDGVVRATRNVDLSVEPGEIVGLVGESGSGKSVLLRTIMRMLRPPGRVVSGTIHYDGRDMSALSERELRRMRGGEIALIPQDPVNSLNPSLSIGYQVTRALRLHRGEAPAEGWRAEAVRILREVGVSVEGGKLRQHPFNFSQGQVQRIMTAVAVLAGRPRLLLADEPTTSLDATVEAQILWLIRSLQRETHTAIIFVTHDLGVIAQLADRVAVMYAGSIVEHGPVRELFANPLHPYTIGLLLSSRGFTDREAGSGRLYAMPGAPPDLTSLGPGCPFAPRCEWADERCRTQTPPLRPFRAGVAACHHLERIHGAT